MNMIRGCSVFKGDGPVIIVANYRTGSTALADVIHNENNLAIFIEPTCGFNSEYKELRFNKYIDSGKTNYVLKIMPDQINDNPRFIRILEDHPRTFKIKLWREDLLQTIASYYIARMTNKWHKKVSDPDILPEIMAINMEIIDESIKKILHNEDLFMTELCDVKWNTIVKYEDIGLIENSIFIPMEDPLNYKEIESTIATRIPALHSR